jgi:signal transduction histidine kinase
MALSFQEGDRIVLEGGEPFEMEEVLQREDGPHTYASVCFPLLDQNSIPYAVGRIALDITENKRLEAQFRQAQKMESIGRLAGGIAHDFNNLLTAITGYVDLAIDTLPQTHPVRDDLNEINKAADRAATLTRQLLAFARRQVIEPQILNLSTMIVDMSKLLRRLLGEDIDLTTLPDPQLWSVKADPGQIEQVVINLAVNARDAMPRGGKLLIETQNTRLDDLYTSRHIDVAPGEYVQLAVTDTGQGIPPDVQSRIFEPFFTTKEAGKGTGLGLATCYGIIKQHGGHIGFYSEEGRGTTFKIYLPRAIEGTSLRERKVEPREYASGTETVLLVEDEDMVRDMSARILRAQGYTVVEAINGVEALQLVSKHVGKTFDIVVTDVVMPRMGGEALVKQLILLQPSIKVLFVSGYTDNMLRQDDWLGPNRAILQKPFTRDALSRKVRELLDQ